MIHKIFSLISMLMVAILFAACAPQARATKSPATPVPSVHGDPTEIQASLMVALGKAGEKVELGNSVEQPFFSIKGRILKVNGVDVQVFEYKSAEAMEADAAQVSPDGGSVGTSMVTWMATPHFFKAGRVIVLYVGDDVAVLNSLMSVLGEPFAGR